MTSTQHNTNRQVVKVGIDFGTTYTSVAFFLLNVTDDRTGLLPGDVDYRAIQRVIYEGNEAVKSEFAWNENEDSWLWGQQVDRSIHDGDLPDSECIQMIKLGLDSSAHTTVYRDHIARRIAELPEDRQVSEQELVSLYLEELLIHAQRKIGDTFRRAGEANILERAEFEYTFCIPAMWDSNHSQNDGQCYSAGWSGVSRAHF